MKEIRLRPEPHKEGAEVRRVRFADGTLLVDGAAIFVDTDVETLTFWYDEQAGCSTFSDDPNVRIIVEKSSWVEPVSTEPDPAPDPEQQAAEALADERAAMVAERWQLVLALGQARWEAILAFAAEDTSPWGIKAVVVNATRIPRVSEMVDLLAYILGMAQEDVDTLFREAMAQRA